SPAGIILVCLAQLVAAVVACDRNGNNKPDCSTAILNSNIRNFFDPTRYWICKSAGAAPVTVRCEEELGFPGGFDPKTSNCIKWDDWQYIPPC
ncbi:hypothetical protein KR018_003232, partial [Drosophila ironensis]